MPPLKRKRTAQSSGERGSAVVPFKRSRYFAPVAGGRNIYGSRYARFSRTGLMTRRSYPAELKNIDIDGLAAPTLGTTTGFVTSLNNVVQGVTAVTRIGRGTVMRSVEFRLAFTMAATSTLAESIRVMLVYDRRTNGAAITGATVLETDSIEAPYNMANMGRFKVLYDKTKVIGTGGPQSIGFYFKKKVSLPVNYGLGNAGTVADISIGGLSLVVWSSSTVGTAVPTTDQNFSRVLFQDT